MFMPDSTPRTVRKPALCAAVATSALQARRALLLLLVSILPVLPAHARTDVSEPTPLTDRLSDPGVGAEAAAASVQPPPAPVMVDARLVYQAQVGEARAGRATLEVSMTGDQYRVVGDAQSEGLFESINPWRAQFFAEGGLTDRGPEMHRYYLYEQDDRKRREVTIENGMLRETKNDKPRRTRPPLPGPDILTALFVTPSCTGVDNLHTGRHGYGLVLQEDAGDRCSFEITNEDGDVYRASISYGTRAGVRVPVLIELKGLLTGTMVLASATPLGSVVSDPVAHAGVR